MKITNFRLILIGIAVYAVFKLHQSGSITIPGIAKPGVDISGV